MEKFISKILFFTMLTLALVACKNQESEQVDTEIESEQISEEAEIDEAFTLPIDYIPASLLPQGTDDSSKLVINPIYDPLFFFVEEGLEYRLAEDVAVSDDGLTWTVKLNKDAKWSDGKDITADDLIFSADYDELRNGGTSNIKTCETNGEPIEIKKIDDKTVEFGLPEIHMFYLKRLSNLMLIPAHPFEGDINAVESSGYFNSTDMATSGAYKVSEISSDSYVYTARDDYYRGVPQVKTVVMKLFGEGASRELAFESGEISYLRITNENQLNKYKAEPDKYNIYSFPEGRLNYLQFNPYGPTLSKLSEDARTAICLAIDQQEILDAAYGTEELAVLQNSVVTPQCIGYNPDNKGFEHDLEKAKELAEESGLAGESLTFIYNKDRVNMEEIAIIIQQQLANIGVEVQVIGQDSATFLPHMFKSFEGDPEELATWDLASNGWDSRKGYHNGIMAYLDRPEKWGWSQDMADKVVAMNQEPDIEKSNEILKVIQEQAVDEAWMYYYPCPNFVCVSHKNITGLGDCEIVPEFSDYLDISIE